MTPLIVTGTDTGVGKSVVSAGLTAALGAQYWKPVQSGLEDETDSELVARLTGVTPLPETYRLPLPASPHLSAEDAGVEIDLDALSLPKVDGALVVEGAGGVMVPLNRKHFYLDLFARWQAPIVLVARTQLGTINHTTLSLMALRGAGCNVIGVIFNGAAEPEVEETIAQMANVTHLGRLAPLSELTPGALAEGVKAIDMTTIRAAL
ncbi:dethiobiotin synthase [Aliiroseovarius sp. KMU-50]|uniref:ATP-dependent dethiobiotin synthetase BioD n=1 Tax=Aliiroseovarius salicola TaxID=3009082 RepID=A0ABT4W476_9RHOB|nr:dethiobiotin synthase [Aliiroseovarius sp. KMU-50]MDA5095323.1 dethiobiotin synthase [Aliiroseovarius sp. KMU-50]